ncbi:sensor histidine kinase [Hymenobacter yonginensis]|uniref:histidine kinase n=1 Tax=Hymenobacter yonginensis TaxID=748197 RepID=A0ABY7PU42_9BACT|nr:ATP-binding protein [Hymenobacter yonginensis]WBO86453.1 ATP-binding protein [Hymenobacter yonginensis]
MNIAIQSDAVNASLIVTVLMALLAVRALRRFLDLPTRVPHLNLLLGWIWVPGAALLVFGLLLHIPDGQADKLYSAFVYAVLTATLLRTYYYRPARTLLLALAPLLLLSAAEQLLAMLSTGWAKSYSNLLESAHGFAIIWLITFIIIARNQKKRLEQERLLHEEEEKARRLVEAQNAELERLVAERTATLRQQTEELQQALTDLKNTQAQLIQSEKMASLGELTAGIAHEIQNPLNFVTNFADVSAELVQELEAEQRNPIRNPELEPLLLQDLRQNLEKINHHGHRAASIVRGMLEHSRAQSTERQPIDLNTLADEYLRLAYHGLRAKDKTFNASLLTELDPAIGPVEAVGQDLGRVLLNLFTNAFYAVQKRQLRQPVGFEPTVRVCTRRLPTGAVQICVHDNGDGIPEAVRQKVFQPFFTTKPTGEGTGLGLSLSYDIITNGHNGTLTFDTEEGQGTEFVVTLPGAA